MILTGLDPGSIIRDAGFWIQDQAPLRSSPVKDPGSRIQDLGSWIRDPGSCIQDPGSRIQDPGSGIQDPWILYPGSKIPDPGFWIRSTEDVAKIDFAKNTFPGRFRNVSERIPRSQISLPSDVVVCVRAPLISVTSLQVRLYGLYAHM